MPVLGWVVGGIALAFLFKPSYSARTAGNDTFKDKAQDILSSLQAANPSVELVRVSQDAPTELADEVPKLAEVSGCLVTVLNKQWKNMKEKIGSGKVGSVWVVQNVADGKDYALKMMRIRREKETMSARGGLAVTLQDFSREVAAQTLAAQKNLAPAVIDYWVCRHASKEEATLGFIVMEKIHGKNLAVYAREVHQSDIGVWCQRNTLGVQPLKGFIPQEMHQQIQHGVEALDQGGLYILDLHVGNIMIEDGTNRLLFIDFGDVSGCEHKKGHAKVDAMAKLGCPIKTSLVELVRDEETSAENLRERDMVFLRGMHDWWIPTGVIKQCTEGYTFTVESRWGTQRKNVAVADLFKFVDAECLHDQDDNLSDNSHQFDNMFERQSNATKEGRFSHKSDGDMFEAHLADIKVSMS